jgi:hypothetical protein
MADKRAFAKFDVGYLDNPKMLDVLDESCCAILMHFASVLYCAQHLTDGIVAAKAMQRKAGGSDADVQLLLTAGLWHEPGHGCGNCPEPPDGKIYVHDFLEHNRDAAQAKRVSEKRSEAATSMWEKKKAMQNALQPAKQNEPVCNAEREREKESVLGPSSRKKPATPLPATWSPNEAHTQYAEAEGIALDFQAERFRTHAEANDRRLVNWDAAFKNWLLKAERTTKTKPAANSPWSKDFHK